MYSLERLVYNGNIIPTLVSRLDFHALEYSAFRILISDFRPNECSVGALEVEWLEGLPHLENLFRW